MYSADSLNLFVSTEYMNRCSAYNIINILEKTEFVFTLVQVGSDNIALIITVNLKFYYKK